MSLTQRDPPEAAKQFEFEPLEYARNYRQALVAEFSPFLRDSVLEVGAGVGHISALISRLPQVRRLVALEPDPQFHPRLRQVLPEGAVLGGTIDQVQEDSWSALVCVNVLEHIEDDRRELENYRARLRRQNGCLCLFVPARQELYAPIDRDFGHYRRYSRPELAEKLTRAGFEIRRLHYYNSLGYFIWWLNFKTLKNRKFDRSKIVVFDRFIFPVVHWLESKIMYPPFGQSLLAVARA
jgi:SAM-dependent methyltransferase